jgi:hypothetical protein
MNEQYISRDPEVMSGALCFKGTRVLVQNLFDYLEGNSSIEEFLDDFPSCGSGSRSGQGTPIRRYAFCLTSQFHVG